jgi:predicted XRE-type DNA-binding protein
MSQSMEKNQNVTVTTGSENVFEDLGFENADEMMAEALLSHQIYKIIKRRKLSQRQAGQLLGIAQPDVNKLMNGKYTEFSIRRLSQILNRLGRDIEIVVKRPTKRGATGKLTVRAA